MEKGLRDVKLLFFLLMLPLCSSLPMCNDLSAPSRVNGRLGFCRYTGNACCSLSEDRDLERAFMAMNISDSACAAAVQSVLCARCDPFAAKLFNAESNLRPLPFLCNSTTGNSNSSFCSTVWASCRDTLIVNSPFAPALQTRARVSQNLTVSRLTDFWQSESDFCNAFGTSPEANSTCFNGGPVSLNATNRISPPRGLCLEKIANESYINLIPHPDGSNRAFFHTLAGKIYLAELPDQDSGDEMNLDESNLFVDLSDQVFPSPTFGMTGLAFHPNFVRNGRFFASFNCDRNRHPNCRGRCACNSDVNCDPSELFTAGEQPCRYHTVIAEYTANGTSSNPSAVSAREVRRIFTLGLPFSSNHGGQIVFGPDDGYLYFMMGDGGGRDDPFNFAQNKRSLLGKIMRIDIDNIPSQDELLRLGRWGNYSVPGDNPISDDNELEPEIWAYGFRNPWRCSFDSERPSYFFCGDIGQDLYEEIDLVYRGGNYGWGVFEGLISHPQNSSRGHTSAQTIDPILPILGYSHSQINRLGSAAIVGGYMYRSQADPCAYGSYLYADLYANHIWTAPETPSNSGNFTATDVPFTCAQDSPITCDLVLNSSLPALQLIFSFGEDNRNDVYILAQAGVYRVVRPSRCNYLCSREVLISSSRPTTPQPSSGYNSPSSLPKFSLFAALCLLLVFLY